MNDGKKFRHYQEYETKKNGKVRLLKYSQESEKKRKVCKVDGDSKDYFFVPESELIPHGRTRKKRAEKRTSVEAQREFYVEMAEKGYKPKTFFISEPNLKKLEALKEKSKISKWNDFMNHLIESL